MSMSANEVIRWIISLPIDCEIAIDEGGLSLVQVGTNEEIYIEVGGEPEDDE